MRKMPTKCFMLYATNRKSISRVITIKTIFPIALIQSKCSEYQYGTNCVGLVDFVCFGCVLQQQDNILSLFQKH